MAMAIPLILDFLARMLNLGSLADRIQKIIERVRKPIDQILDKIINWVINKVKKLFGKDKKKEKGSKEPGTELEDREVGERIEFVADGEVHHLWINTKGGIKVMVASTPSNFEDLIRRWEGKLSEFNKDAEKKAQVTQWLEEAKEAHAVTKRKAIDTEALMNKEKRNAATPQEVKVSDDATEAAQHKLKNVLKQLFEFFREENGYSPKEGKLAEDKDNVSSEVEKDAAKTGVNAVEQVAVHGNSLKSLKPTWGYKLYSNDGTFLKNGITSKLVPESRYTKSFMSDKYMVPVKQFPNRKAAWDWEFGQNQILRGPLNKNMH
jgi:hypothetical protein